MTDNRWNIGEGGDMPIGFGLSLAANSKSMQVFARMTDEQKTAVVEQSRTIQSKEEMERFVDRLSWS